MKIVYFGKEQTSGFIQTMSEIQGGHVAEIDDNHIEYIDWSSFDFVKQLSQDAIDIGLPNTLRHYNEYWSRDDDPSIISTTWKLTKVMDGVKQPDMEGNTWTKHTVNWTDAEESAITEFDKAWLEGKIASVAKCCYTRLNLDRGVVDKETWNLQLQQAKEYKATSSAGNLISMLASARGMTISSFADKIIQKNEAYEQKVGSVLALQQRLRKELNDCASVRDIQMFAQKYTDLIFDRDIDNKSSSIHELFRNIS